jgi:polysaccharide pyruvyl transferase WcaK-like protein
MFKKHIYFKTNIKSYKIVLLTPYTGGNLGDAAIQEAVINQIRKRCKSANLRLISLCPKITSRLHEITSFPITPFAMKSYSPGPSINNLDINQNQAVSTKKRLKNQLEDILNSFPIIFHIIEKSYQAFSLIFKAPFIIFLELVHALQGYMFVKGSKMLIVSGGGQLDDYWGGAWGHPYALAKWGIIAKIARAKYVFLSVGYCDIESRLSRFFIKKALSFSSYRSYRDHNSKKLLKYLQYTDKDPVYPDLAFSYIKNYPIHELEKNQAAKTVGISPIAYLSRLWPKNDFQIYENYLNTLKAFALDLFKQGYNIVFFSTDRPDRQVNNDIIEYFLETVDGNEMSKKITHHCPDTLDELFEKLLHVEYVVASRLHGILLSHIINKPAIAVSYDRKVDTYMSDLGLIRYCLDIHKVEITSLKNTFQKLVKNGDSVKIILEKKAKQYFLELQNQYDLLLEK